MPNETRDLRDVGTDISAVKRLASSVFGFQADLVIPLEVYTPDPGCYCMFEVMDVQYQVENGALSIYSQNGDER